MAPDGGLSRKRKRATSSGTVGAFFREESKVMELGWNTYRDFWGKGFANEAAAAVADYALEIRHEPTVRALIASANESSLRVARRLGLTYEEESEIYGKAVGIYVPKQDGAVKAEPMPKLAS